MSDVGQRLVDGLIAHGIKRVFGVPGGQTTPFYHGIATRPDDITHVLMRDERSAVFAADAYARISRTVGVCDATVGPGATNLVSGLVEAYASSIPVLAVIADIPRGWSHRRHLGSASQGVEQRDFLASTVKWYGRVETPEQIDDVLDHCLNVATSNRPGPVVIELPDDVISAEFPPAPLRLGRNTRYPRVRFAPDPMAVQAAATALRSSEKPVILAGGGVHISGAVEEVTALAERLGALVATTISGKGSIEETNDLAIGIAGSFGSSVANEKLAEADCVLAIGSKLGQAATDNWTLPRAGATVIHIDVDAEEIDRNFPGSIALQADAKLGMAALADALGDGPSSAQWNVEAVADEVAEWWEHDTYATPPEEDDKVKPQEIVRRLGAQLGPEDVIVSDASLSSGWAASRWRIEAAGRRHLAPRGVAGLGWGLPAAIGAAFAMKDGGGTGRVVCLAGDGAWAYSVADLEVAARFELTMPCVLLNNSILGWNKHVAMRRYPDGWVSQDFGAVNWTLISEGFGAAGARLDHAEGLDVEIAKALAHANGPYVLEVISSEVESPVLNESGVRQSVGGY